MRFLSKQSVAIATVVGALIVAAATLLATDTIKINIGGGGKSSSSSGSGPTTLTATGSCSTSGPTLASLVTSQQVSGGDFVNSGNLEAGSGYVGTTKAVPDTVSYTVHPGEADADASLTVNAKNYCALTATFGFERSRNECSPAHASLRITDDSGKQLWPTPGQSSDVTIAQNMQISVPRFSAAQINFIPSADAGTNCDIVIALGNATFYSASK